MSGFGIRALKKKSQDELETTRTQYFKYIVCGENISGVLTFLHLNRKYPGEVKLITKNSFLKEEILKEYQTTLPSIRSQEAADAIVSLSPRLEVFKNKSESVFYKDTKFQSFEGRAKPHEMMELETFFKDTSFEMNFLGLFQNDEYENLDTLLKEHQLHKIISEIEVTTPTDLVEKTHFNIKTGEFESFRCEKLYFCESPRKFMNLVSNKDMLSDSVSEFATAIENTPAIVVNTKVSTKLYDNAGTVIIPQSMTHDWGSFMVEFEAYSPDTETQEFKSLMFLEGDGMQEEELAKKIRHMKRVIERVFPELSDHEVSSNIRYDHEYHLGGINKTHYEVLKNEYVRFLGHASSLPEGLSDHLTYLARSIYAILIEQF